MDDDGSGSLSWPEFEKGMKELKMCFLLPAAVKHLFKYFGEEFVRFNSLIIIFVILFRYG